MWIWSEFINKCTHKSRHNQFNYAIYGMLRVERVGRLSNKLHFIATSERFQFEFQFPFLDLYVSLDNFNCEQKNLLEKNGWTKKLDIILRNGVENLKNSTILLDEGSDKSLSTSWFYRLYRGFIYQFYCQCVPKEGKLCSFAYRM